MLAYLGRYVHRVAIYSDRIFSMTGNTVFIALYDSVNGNRKKVVRMEAGEFIGRFVVVEIITPTAKQRYPSLRGSP